MLSRRPNLLREAASLGTAAWLLLGLGGMTRAQHTPDPYNIVGEYNSQYEPYMYASFPTAAGTQPNQGRYGDRSGLRSANSFQDYVDSEGDDSGEYRRAPRPSGPGTPYYRAYRRYDQEFQRTYRPNEAADRSYYSDQDKRNDKYFQALREPDPRKRSQMLRDYNLENKRAARDLSPGRNGSEKDREPARERFSPGGTSLYPEEAERPEPRRSTSSAPAPRQPAGSPSSSAPPARGRSTGTTAPAATGHAPPPPRASTGRSSSAPSAPGTTRGASPSASDLLKRSELLDRATRSTTPTLPSSTAPPAPR